MTTLKSYIIGFVLSVLLTLSAYSIVYLHVSSSHLTFSHNFLVIEIIIFAMLQFLTQLIFFLHLGQESKPHWNLVAFISTISIVLIFVIGSLWIMSHLNYNMTSSEMDSYMLQMEGIKK